MSSEVSNEILQSMLKYYYTKCSQLEYEFLLYKLKSESRIKEYESLISESKKEKGFSND